ncbi:hypothetical protein DMUE_3259 [Dictyocoela muelleri]|nr:hypothetical protein DMUE_3259 [Dictyocoela muelleri]
MIHESENSLNFIEIQNVQFVLEKIGFVSTAEFERLITQSGEYVGCTGDNSLSKVLSANKVPLYQVLKHKDGFTETLEKMWTEAGGDAKNFNLMMLKHSRVAATDILKFNYNIDSFMMQFNRFLEKLYSRTTQEDLEKYLFSNIF